MFSKSSIELTIESRIIPASVGCMFGKLDHVLVDMLVVLHFECAKSAFRSLCDMRLAEEVIQFRHEFAPVAANRGFWLCDQVGLPPEHHNVREVRGHVGDLLMFGCELARAA